MYSPTLSQRDEAGVIPPPPGITPNFANPPSRAHAIIGIHIVCAILSTVFTMLRSYTVYFITRHVKIDDYLLLVAWSLALAYSVTASIITQYGHGRHLWDVPFSAFSPNYMKVGAISVTFYGISIMLTKLSILALFIRFVPRGNNLRLIIHITMAVVTLYSLVASFQWVYACQPLEKYWDLTITSGSCINRLNVSLFNGVMNTVTDAVILILPALFLRHLQIPKRQKIGVTIILMTGGFVLAVSIVRVVQTAAMVNTKDITWESFPNAVWWTIEVHVAIICACLPTGKPFLRKHMPRIMGRSYGAGSAATRLNTLRTTHTKRLPSTDPSEDPQGITLDDNINRKGPIAVSITTIDVATEQAVQAEYSSERGLIITDSRELGHVGRGMDVDVDRDRDRSRCDEGDDRERHGGV